jgi:hypothetical protein
MCCGSLLYTWLDGFLFPRWPSIDEGEDAEEVQPFVDLEKQRQEPVTEDETLRKRAKTGVGYSTEAESDDGWTLACTADD